MAEITQDISSLGSIPTTADSATFDTRADTFLGTSLPTLRTEINTWAGQANTVAGEVNTNANTASTAATTATNAKNAAEAASNAMQWVSGQAYAEGDVVWSPINFLSYRANTPTSGTTDPSLSADWVALSPLPVPPGWALLSTVTASASATVDIETTLDSTYDSYVIVATGVKSVNNGAFLYARVKSGGSYLSTGVYQFHTHYGENNDPAYKSLVGSAATQISVIRSIDNDANDNCNFQMSVFSPSGTSLQKCLQWQGVSTNTASTFNSGGGWVDSIAAITGVRFYCSAGNIDSGEFRLYGIRKV